ncbi:MAG: hypothetical protein AB3A66_22530 [Nodularia sp. CChRGM 3473]
MSKYSLAVLQGYGSKRSLLWLIKGCIREHERCGICFDEPIGYRVSRDGDKFPLHYAEMKVKGNKYHVIPRTKSSR